MGDLATDLVQGRECGDCRICCLVPPVDEPEMQKQTGVLCRHRAAHGCNIYETRPLACRTYFCGWRRMAFLDDDWRPDRSGLLIETGTSATVGEGSTVLILVGNPLKTLRQQRFLDLVARNIGQNVTLWLSLPGPPGMAKAALPLNTPQIRSAAAGPRSNLRLALEDVLRRLSSHAFVPYPLQHGGNEVSG